MNDPLVLSEILRLKSETINVFDCYSIYHFEINMAIGHEVVSTSMDI